MNDYKFQNIKSKASQNDKNRRKAPRFDASAIPSLKSVSKVEGPEVKLINISRGGAPIESPESLSRGSSVCLRLAIAERVYHLNGLVLRCSVSPVKDNAPQYQSAIAFEEDFTMLPSNREVEVIYEGAQAELVEI